MDDEATMAMYEELADSDGECWRCDGSGLAEYEPIPGTHHEMGVSVRERCHVCRGSGSADVFVGGRDITSKAESGGF